MPDQEEYLSWLIDKEIAVMSVLDHAHIVHLNEVFDEEVRTVFVSSLQRSRWVRNILTSSAVLRLVSN